MAVERLQEARLLPVVEIPDGVDAIELADALTAGGISLIEVTLRTPRAIDAIRAIRAARRDVFVVAGTVLSVDQADAAVDAGAELIVSPGLSPAVVGRCVELGVAVLPGVQTPTEVEMGLALGLSAFKFFPAEAAGGVRYLSAMVGPYPFAGFVPTGGINPTNLGAYLGLPNVLACGGSWMVSRELLASRDFATVRRLTAEAMAIVRGTGADAMDRSDVR